MRLSDFDTHPSQPPGAYGPALRISLALRSSAFSRRNRFSSADSSLVVPGR